MKFQGLQKNKNEDNYTAVVQRLFSRFPDKMQYSNANPKRCRTLLWSETHNFLHNNLHNFVIR